MCLQAVLVDQASINSLHKLPAEYLEQEKDKRDDQRACTKKKWIGINLYKSYLLIYFNEIF